LEKTLVKRVDSGTIDSLIKKEEPLPSALNEEESNTVKTIFEKAIKKPGMNVHVESLSPSELPVTVTMDEFMRRMKDMAAMGGGGMNFYGSLPDNYNVTVNSNHPLINKIAQAGTEEEKAGLAKQAFDLALLSQGMLTGAELTDFVKRSVAML
jgi:molecular chaperone HtpG